MDRVDTSGSDLDLDIDLESGGTTSEEDASKSQVLGCENSKNLWGRIRSGFMRSELLCESANGGDCSCSYDKFIISDEISAKNKEQLGKFREEMISFVHKTMDEEKPKKQNSAKPSKPPRPPRGPSLDASDIKLLKEITELNLKRKRMERSRTLKKIKKEKASSLNSNLFACLVTIVFFMVIIFQGLLGSRI
ncbi:hypothetical protein Pfo_005136 [Paulownia fortunei]|nr:hypothetical protein Pfo_005136 [Paulownia fortunei]